MQYSISLDSQQIICVETLKSLRYLTSIQFTLTIDTNLQQKLSKISQFVEFLSENPTVKTRLKVLSINKNPLKEYKVVTVGGTFDHLHIGHQILLLYAALSATQTIHIGITADWLLAHKKYNQVIQNMLVRMRNVLDFCKSINPTLQLVAYQLNDSVGTNTTQKDIQCVIFSPQPGDNLIEINTERVKNGLKELQVVRCPLLTPTQKYHEKFSSTYIRSELLEKNQMSKEELQQYRERFDDLIAKLTKINGQNQINSKAICQFWFEQIYFTYSQPWRFYHTNRHIFRLFKTLNSTSYSVQRGNLTLEQQTSLGLALFFHHFCYLPGNSNNKAQSAIVCQKFAEEYLGNSSQHVSLIKQAKRLVIQAQSLEKPKCVLSQLVYDLQMGVLNQPTQYKLFAQGIKKEYSAEFGRQFAKKRVEYLTAIFKQGLHFSFKAENVQANLKWEMQILQQSAR